MLTAITIAFTTLAASVAADDITDNTICGWHNGVTTGYGRWHWWYATVHTQTDRQTNLMKTLSPPCTSFTWRR